MDLRKAYDSVWRQDLMFKLLSQNVSGIFFRIVTAMYINNNICVKINNCERTIFLRVMSECPQFFNHYISDLKAFLGVDNDTPKLVSTLINCLMYAYDLVLMSRSESGLQILLNSKGEYCRKWRMEVNIEKTKAVKFSGKGHKCKSVFLYNGKPLENLPKYKYLGIETSSSCLWSSAIANITNPGKKALFLLKDYICSENIKPGSGLKLLDQMIRPIL